MCSHLIARNCMICAWTVDRWTTCSNACVCRSRLKVRNFGGGVKKIFFSVITPFTVSQLLPFSQHNASPQQTTKEWCMRAGQEIFFPSLLSLPSSPSLHECLDQSTCTTSRFPWANWHSRKKKEETYKNEKRRGWEKQPFLHNFSTLSSSWTPTTRIPLHLQTLRSLRARSPSATLRTLFCLHLLPEVRPLLLSPDRLGPLLRTPFLYPWGERLAHQLPLSLSASILIGLKYCRSGVER